MDFRVGFSSWIFELGFRVGVSSWIFELEFRVGFRVGFSSKDVDSVFSRWLLVIQLQRIGEFCKPSRRFPVQYSQQKNSCRGGVIVLPFYRVRISSWIFELDFELDFRVRISSWIFELDFELDFRVRM